MHFKVFVENPRNGKPSRHFPTPVDDTSVIPEWSKVVCAQVVGQCSCTRSRALERPHQKAERPGIDAAAPFELRSDF